MRVLIADDEKNIRDSLKRLLELEGIEAVAAEDGVSAKICLENNKFDLALLDLKMPGFSGQDLVEWIGREGLVVPVIIISAHGEIADAVRALKSGARDFLEKPFDSSELVAKIRRTVEEENLRNLREAARRTGPERTRLVGEHASICSLRARIFRIADTGSTVLITGESGTGKEVAAREIHDLSARAGEPFVAVNIGSVPESLMESELFGHEKGAYTSADSRRLGLFELAGSGTVFLDEIGDMPLALQVKLLRVLQERKIRRLGGIRDIPVAARILSATNRDLEKKVAAGLFREDLFYRLNVIRLVLPPLRERLSDIPLLCEVLLNKLCRRLNIPRPAVSPDAMEKLQGYSYPGNVRELENILERSVIYSRDGLIRREDIDVRPPEGAPASCRTAGPDAAALTGANPGDEAPAGGLRRIERDAVAGALRRCSGNRTRAARELGISRRTIIYKIKEYGLEA
jgi:two-component system response regulator AtoC